MATIKIEIVAGGNTYSRTKTISGPDLLRFLGAYRSLLGQVPSGPADPITGVVPMRDMTDTETALAWADGIFKGTMNNVKRVEQDAAAKAPVAAVVEIPLT